MTRQQGQAIVSESREDQSVFLLVSLENYPAEGPTCHWYVLDAMRGPFDWRTIWVDLKRPEELKLPRAGDDNQIVRALTLRGDIKHTRREGEAPGKHMWLGKIRFVKAPVRIDWDQRQATFEWGTDADQLRLLLGTRLTQQPRLGL